MHTRLFPFLLLLAGCSSTPAAPDAALPDDASTADLRDTGPTEPPPIAPPFEPEPLVPTWYSGFIPVEDPVADAVEAGTFTVPTAEGTIDGVEWTIWDPGPDGTFRAITGGTLWAAATLDVPEGRNVIVRTELASAVHLGTQSQPGDIYGSGRIRVPLVAGRGVDLAIRLASRRGAPTIQLWTTPDELWMNPNDVTVPDIVVGETDEQWLGIATLDLTDTPAFDATARVVGDEHWMETTTSLPSLPAGAVTQVPFRLVPRVAFDAPVAMVPVRLRIESTAMRFSYERVVHVAVVARGETYRRTFRSAIDGSAQYYGVRPPADADRTTPHALVLSLHGASVEAMGQAAAYSARDWLWLVAATNRRPFGFDWEAWGRLDALEVLEDARSWITTDPTRVYLTGHSMGGHGSWQLGTLFPGRFAVVGPSAGWASFYSYTGRTRPSGAFARSMASSDTPAYATNLARRSVYIIHGSADDNVPVREARDWVTLLTPIVPALTYHEEPDVGHWWDGDAAPGADCVDWVPLFDTMMAARLDPSEVEFDFLSPSPSVSPRHSFVTIRSAVDDMAGDVRVVSATSATDELTLTTTNVRSMTLDGDALSARGIARVVVDGVSVVVTAGEIEIGPQSGKRPDAYGPFNQVLSRAYCYAYADDAPQVVRDYAAFLASWWSVQGNGAACALPESYVDRELLGERNVVWLGAIPSGARWSGALPFARTATEVRVGTDPFEHSMLVFTFPEGDGERLGGGIVVTEGDERLLFHYMPFTSGFAAPDWFVLSGGGVAGAGFLSPTWALP